MDTGKPQAKKLEVVVLTQDQNGQVNGKSLSEVEINELLKKNGFSVEQIETE